VEKRHRSQGGGDHFKFFFKLLSYVTSTLGIQIFAAQDALFSFLVYLPISSPIYSISVPVLV